MGEIHAMFHGGVSFDNSFLYIIDADKVKGMDVNEAPVEILLVEDNPSDVELILRALKKYRITGNLLVAKDGVEALDFVFGTGQHSERNIDIRPKLIVLDLKLPKVSGLEVLEKIKSDPRTKMIPVVILTSSREEDNIMRSFDLGVNSYVVKPVEFDKFVQTVVDLALYWLQLNEAPVLKYH